MKKQLVLRCLVDENGSDGHAQMPGVFVITGEADVYCHIEYVTYF